ncbi:response regulator [Ancylothrix sp. C2]|uniref:response regulator n=1 Tax=Ancylothrix sp. D3o TaxID=2953691 RepID=UPI0021BBA3F1|nr:response regulator [Ancylothrix sp. D3o]MCT7951368.1 response regulator [Ancylothrix sp. D3o]
MTTNLLQTSRLITEQSKMIASPAKALTSIVSKKLTGRLTIGDPNDTSVFWRVYFGKGQVHFASSAMGHHERLPYLLQWYYPELKLVSMEQFSSDYEVICHYWQTGKISLQQARKLLTWLTEEAFVQILSIPQATLQFEKNLGLDPILLSLPIKEIVTPVKGFINQWVKLYNEIPSPYQRPIVQDIEKLCKIIWPKIGNMEFLKTFAKVIRKNISLYEAATLLKIDTLSLATLLKPAVKSGAVSMSTYQEPQRHQRPLIACIDDSKTAQRQVKLTLEASGYQVLSLTQPAAALTILAKQKPALILLDINMPEISGYELCKMLRNSSLLKDIPIVMVTGRDGIVDKLRARMVGATDYLTKPFYPQQLINTIETNLYSETQQTQIQLQPSNACA